MLSEDLRVKLAADLPRDMVKTRSQAGQTLSYVDGHYVVEHLNRVFGFDGWSFTTDPAREMYRGTRPGKDGENVVIVYEVRGTLRALGVERVDVGVGQCDAGSRALAQGIEKALKEAATDALKRCARTFGASFGLALYDKEQRRVGISTAALAMLDEIAEADSVDALKAIVSQDRARGLDDDEKDVIRGAIAGRRKELVAQPAVVTQPAPQQLPPPAPTAAPAPTAPAPSQTAANDPPTAPANDGVSPPRVAPARALLEDRLARARSAESIIATVLAAPLSDEDRSAVRPAIAAAAQRCGITSDALRSRLDAARKVAATPAQWGVAAEILLDLEAAGDVATLDVMRARHAPRATGLPAELVSAVKRRSAEIRNALGAPGPSADAMIAEVNAATTVDGLRSVQARLRTAAEKGTITQADAQRVTDALNDRGEQIAMREAS